MTDGPFHVTWEACNNDDWDNPDAEWKPREKTVTTELEATQLWGSLKRFVNTRPVSITPEPDWSRYSYDGKTPVAKW